MTALNRPEALLVAGRFPSTSLPGLYFEAQAIPGVALRIRRIRCKAAYSERAAWSPSTRHCGYALNTSVPWSALPSEGRARTIALLPALRSGPHGVRRSIRNSALTGLWQAEPPHVDLSTLSRHSPFDHHP